MFGRDFGRDFGRASKISEALIRRQAERNYLRVSLTINRLFPSLSLSLRFPPLFPRDFSLFIPRETRRGGINMPRSEVKTPVGLDSS